MADLAQLTDPMAVRAAIDECRRVGRDVFLERYGFGRARSYFVVDDGELFDSKAIVGVAFGYQLGTPLPPADFSGGESTAVSVLRRLGFRVDRVSEWVAAVRVDDVRSELELFQQLGRDAYVARYGGGPAAKFYVVDDGQQCDAKAVLVSAMRRATGIPKISHLEVDGTEAGVANPLRALGFEVVSGWPFTKGQVLARKNVHDLVGGNRQRGISRVSGSNEVLIFSDPVRGRRYGYDRFEGLREDGSYWYTGEGKIGDQSLGSPGNRSIANADLEGLTLRLFVTENTSATYMGEVVTGDPPYEWRRAPDENGEERNVIVFHLVPVDQLVTPKIALPATQRPTPWTPPSDGDIVLSGGLINGRIMSRREMRLQADFGLWLQAQGHSVVRRPIPVPTKGVQVYPDLYDETTLTVFEAKKSAAREYVREAIGQVLDYQNLLRIDGVPGVQAAILLPGVPDQDLVDLCGLLAITIFTPTDNGFAAIDLP